MVFDNLPAFGNLTDPAPITISPTTGDFGRAIPPYLWAGLMIGSLRKRELEKIMASIAQTTCLSKLSFPRYTTGLATTPQVHQTLALYILRATQGTHVSDHRESPTPILTSSTRRTLPRFRSPPHIH